MGIDRETPQMRTPLTNGSTDSPQEQSVSLKSKKLLLDPCEESDFEMGRVLGVGSFGSVSIARHKETGVICAIKQLSKLRVLKQGQLEHLKEEKGILSIVDHPFFTKIWGSFQNEDSVFLVLEFVAGGEFFTHLRIAGRFSEPTTKFYIAQIVVAFEYLHSQKIVYRDLKPENILLDVHGNVKITDFGFAKKIKRRTFTLCGTPDYLAPEIILNKGHGFAVDWWALGILIYECLSGHTPFYDEDPMNTYRKILSGKFAFPSYFSTHARDLIKKLLTADLTRRLGTLAGGVADVKAHPWFRGINWGLVSKRAKKAPITPIVLCNDDTQNFDHYDASTNTKHRSLTEMEQAYFEEF
eukprot:g8111.t1